MPPANNELVVHVLNVGDGDDIIIDFPGAPGQRRYAVVDCYNGVKTVKYLNDSDVKGMLEFVCATHPHDDHINGMSELLTSYRGRVHEFWDSGFRHTIPAYEDMIAALEADPDLRYFRVTSGMERRINGVKVSVLAPSMYLRNRFDTYGIDINNASVVLMLEYNRFKMVLGGDAQFTSWSKILEEYPDFKKTVDPSARVQIKEAFNPLNCNVLKVSHHCSNNGTAFECINMLDPEYAIVSCSGASTHDFPHPIARMCLEKIVGEDKAHDRVMFTDYEGLGYTRKGSIVVSTSGTGSPTFRFLGDRPGDFPAPP